ncbi:MAG: ASCH domain-containing protein [Alphaproteobacteria bacterium]|nr:ASCH domain-containing protein [Alphaproteobacteria bacterium]
MAEKWTFDNDELFDLVTCGKKRGTCCLYENDESMSKVGDTNIIYNSKNEQIKIKITNVCKCRFCDIDESWAIKEGESDMSLAYWQNVHMAFFKNVKTDFKETDMLELNEFMVV